MMNMFDPEMMRVAQERMSRMGPEEMSRMGPEEMARIQQQMMSNSELMRLSTHSTEDVRRAAEQLGHARPEEMAEIGEKMANVTPEEVAAMKARTDAQFTYELDAARMLKEQGNELHRCGKFSEAVSQYLLAKDNLKGVSTAKGRTLQLHCSLNLMSCYLRTKQFDDCIKEGSEVLSYDTKNYIALYRRGQAYNELGMLKVGGPAYKPLRMLDAAVSDLEKAHELFPESKVIADVLRGATENLMDELKNWRIDWLADLVTEETDSTADMQENMRNSVKEPTLYLMVTLMIKNMSPAMLSNLSKRFGMNLSKEDAAKARQVLLSLSPDELDKMICGIGRPQSGIETVKNWLMGKFGMILAILVLILAFIFNRLGFIGA